MAKDAENSVADMSNASSWILDIVRRVGLGLTQEGCLMLTLADKASLDEDWDDDLEKMWDVGDLSLQAHNDYHWLGKDD